MFWFIKSIGAMRETAKSAQKRYQIFQWEKSPNPRSTKFSGTGHLLVVLNPVYAKLARVCVASFLSHNPNFRLIVHCDKLTFPEMTRQLSTRSNFYDGRVIVLVDCDAGDLTWQKTKLNLLLGLSGTSDFFMDADLRWNGKLDTTNEVSFFVKEFSMHEKSPYRQITRHPAFAEAGESAMHNTSYFSFGTKVLTSDQRMEIENVFDKFPQILEESDIGIYDKQILARLSEQITLSVIIPKFFSNIEDLKISDGHRDGGFVESSYFGATGSQF